MDFLERWFGISPDGGSGTFEVSLVFAVVVVALVCIPKLFGTLQGWRQRVMRTRA
jgi:hypothetical protein